MNLKDNGKKDRITRKNQIKKNKKQNKKKKLNIFIYSNEQVPLDRLSMHA